MSRPATSQRVKGHTLEHEGWPHSTDGQRFWGSELAAGWGCGMCSCGALSNQVQGNAARKRWHREHKAEVLAAADRSEHER